MFFANLLPHPQRIADVARVLRFYQRSGLQFLARAIGILKLLRPGRSRAPSYLALTILSSLGQLGRTFPATGPRRARVAFFAGCVAHVTFTQPQRSHPPRPDRQWLRSRRPRGTTLLRRARRSCGRPRRRARSRPQEPRSFLSAKTFDAIVTNAAGCGSTLKEYDHLFSQEEPEYQQAVAFGEKVRDVTEFLADLGLCAPLQPLKPLRLRVTYQDSCHLLHGQKVRNAPRKLLRAIPGLEFVELPNSEICCGSAGVYNVTQTQASLELLADKMHHAAATSAEVIVTANPGCLLQLRAGGNCTTPTRKSSTSSNSSTAQQPSHKLSARGIITAIILWAFPRSLAGLSARYSLPTTRYSLPPNTTTPLPRHGGRRGKGVPSSGEKIVTNCEIHYSGAGPPGGSARMAPRAPPLGPPCCTV